MIPVWLIIAVWIAAPILATVVMLLTAYAANRQTRELIAESRRILSEAQRIPRQREGDERW